MKILLVGMILMIGNSFAIEFMSSNNSCGDYSVRSLWVKSNKIQMVIQHDQNPEFIKTYVYDGTEFDNKVLSTLLTAQTTGKKIKFWRASSSVDCDSSDPITSLIIE